MLTHSSSVVTALFALSYRDLEAATDGTYDCGATPHGGVSESVGDVDAEIFAFVGQDLWPSILDQQSEVIRGDAHGVETHRSTRESSTKHGTSPREPVRGDNSVVHNIVLFANDAFQNPWKRPVPAVTDPIILSSAPRRTSEDTPLFTHDGIAELGQPRGLGQLAVIGVPSLEVAPLATVSVEGTSRPLRGTIPAEAAGMARRAERRGRKMAREVGVAFMYEKLRSEDRGEAVRDRGERHPGPVCTSSFYKDFVRHRLGYVRGAPTDAAYGSPSFAGSAPRLHRATEGELGENRSDG
jgi:hypothetical protein